MSSSLLLASLLAVAKAALAAAEPRLPCYGLRFNKKVLIAIGQEYGNIAFFETKHFEQSQRKFLDSLNIVFPGCRIPY